MNAEDQKILERIEFNKGGLVLNDIDWLISQLKAAQEENERLKNQWQPIETAPKDVEKCFLWCADKGGIPRKEMGLVLGRIIDGYPYGNGMNGDWNFTHWQPLLQPPKI